MDIITKTRQLHHVVEVIRVWKFLCHIVHVRFTLFLSYSSSFRRGLRSSTTHTPSFGLLRLSKHLPACRISVHPSRSAFTGLWGPSSDGPHPEPLLRLQALWPNVPPAQPAAAALRPVPAEGPAARPATCDGKQEEPTADLPAGLQPLPLHCVQPGVQPHGEPQDSPSHPHGGAALHLLGVCQVFPSLGGVDPTLPHPHRREALRLCSVWEVF